VAEEEVGGEGEGVVDVLHCVSHNARPPAFVNPKSKKRKLFSEAVRPWQTYALGFTRPLARGRARGG
jgi:hypothetical protein